MRLVIVTGMSGSGKRTAIKMLEDSGYYCVDNLPVQLIEMFVELIELKDSELSKVALGIDARADQPFDEVVKAIEKIKSKGVSLEILFMESNDKVLLKRYKESRRKHPLAIDGHVEEGIEKERVILSGIKKEADYVIDTSLLLTRDLKTELDHIFVENKKFNNLMINIESFGFKHGIPQDADLVFDVRFLPNPYYVDNLKSLTGLDKEVQDFVMGFEEAEIFLSKLEDMLMFLIPNYIKEGKYQLVVAIGCTGGHHRSVTLAEKLYARIKDKEDFGVNLTHKDIKRGDK
ncbi:MAG: RNase adapter RapZ [Lachnospiraceae bacterium]|nr:RNase adapter RapZ [Lachnospiraceae bacterium]